MLGFHAILICAFHLTCDGQIYKEKQQEMDTNILLFLGLTRHVCDVILCLFGSLWITPNDSCSFPLFPLQILSFPTFGLQFQLTTRTRNCCATKWHFYGNLQSSMTCPIHSSPQPYPPSFKDQDSSLLPTSKSWHLIVPTTNI